jgi:hypothetical protein
MDWLEDFFPFLRDLDAGNGALEIALVLLVVVSLAAIAVVALRRSRTGATQREEITDRRDRPGPTR